MDRSKGLGGTDIGCIIGVNPWRGPMDVYLEKVGITEGQPDNEAMYWGREMEPVLAKRYRKEIKDGWVLECPNSETLPMVHEKYNWYLGSPDGLMHPINDQFERGGVDFKTTGSRNGWGEPGTDEVPEWIHTQADWYMGLTGAEWWDIAVLFFARREFAIYHIERNQELIDNLIEAGREFWEDHVLPQIPPPIDASEGSKKLLNHLYPRETEDLLEANVYIEPLIRDLQTYEMNRDAIIELLTLTQNKLKNIIGDSSGIKGSFGKITWKKTKDREQVDWMAVANILSLELGNPSFVDEAIKQNTKIIPGSRVFRTYFKREE